jgi:hypothetical protein
MDNSVTQFVFVIALFGVWFILMRVVLPRLGVRT